MSDEKKWPLNARDVVTALQKAPLDAHIRLVRDLTHVHMLDHQEARDYIDLWVLETAGASQRLLVVHLPNHPQVYAEMETRRDKFGQTLPDAIWAVMLRYVVSGRDP